MIKQVWKRHFEEMFTEHRAEFLQDIDKEELSERGEEAISRITKGDIYKPLRQTNNDNAPHPGNIPIEQVKNSPKSVIKLLKSTFNCCLINGQELPKEWKLANTSSLYEKRDKKMC